MKKVLVPIDLKEGENNLIEYAARFAKAYGSELTLLYVQHPVPIAAEGAAVIGYVDNEVALKEMQKNLKNIGDQLISKHLGLRLSTEVVTGFAGDEIVNRSGKDNLVIMGSRRSANPIIKWLGSVSKHVALNANGPVLVVPANVNWHTINNILFGFAENKNSDDHIDTLFTINKVLGADINVAHITANDSDTSLADVEQYLMHQFPGQKINYLHHKDDNVDKALLDLAHDANADILVIAKTNKSIWRYFIEGNHTEHLLRLTDLPLLVLSSKRKV